MARHCLYFTHRPSGTPAVVALDFASLFARSTPFRRLVVATAAAGALALLFGTVAKIVPATLDGLLTDLTQRGKPALDDWAAGVRASKYGAVQLKTVVHSAKVREIEDAFLPESEKRDYESTWGHATPLGEKNL